MVTGKSLWDVDELFRCPVVGLCLSFVEQRCLLKKAGASPEGLTRYDAHEMLVGASAEDNVLSRHMFRLLKSKYERRAAPLRELPEEPFLEAWGRAFASGDYRAELWAAATRDLSDGARRTLYGQMHMAMHGMAGEQIAMRAELEAAHKNLRRKERRLETLRVEHEALHAEVRLLRQVRARLEGERDAARLAGLQMEQQLAEWRSSSREAGPDGENQQLREELAAAETLLAEQETVHARLEARVGELERSLELARMTQMPQMSQPPRTPLSMARESPARDAPPCDVAHCNEDCPSFDLCRKRVLIVGGIERMETLYRKLVEEEGGGILEYHAGHMQGGKKQLEQSLQRADVVLCPVNCNSHGACALVKNLAKKYRKPVHMMPNFSLSAVAGVISGHAGTAGEATAR